jgi:ankyrin repeat protein
VSVLEAAILNFEETAACILIEHGANVLGQLKSRSPLHLTVWCGMPRAAAAMIERGAHVNRADSTGDTPLHYLGSSDQFRLGALSIKTESLEENSSFFNSLQTFFSSFDSEEVAELLIANKAQLFSKNDQGYTPLHEACARDNEAAAQFLISKNKPVLKALGHLSRTPLYIASQQGHDRVVELFLEQDELDVNVIDRFGRTPLSVAAGNGHIKVVRCLLGCVGIDVYKTDIFNMSALDWAIKKKQEQVALELLERLE